MKVLITQLKAPWPEGARVGDTHEFGGLMPAWAIGKCVLAGEPAKVEPSAAELAQHYREEAQAAIEKARAEHDERMGDVVRHHSMAVSTLQQDLAEAQAERDAEKAKVADLTAKLAEAQAAPKADRKPKKGG
jgi:hypothetical protein